MLIRCIHLLFLQEKAQLRQEEYRYADRGSPQDVQAQVITALTPPQSDKKIHSQSPGTPTDKDVYS